MTKTEQKPSVKSVSLYTVLGNYNWANPSEKQYKVEMMVVYDDKTSLVISETFPQEDDEPDYKLPSEALDLIEARVKSYWFSTRRDKDLEKVAKLRERIQEIDRVFLQAKIKRLRSEADDLKEQLRWLEE